MSYYYFKFCRIQHLLLLLFFLFISVSFTLAQDEKTERIPFTENLKFSIGGSIFAGGGTEKYDLFKTSDDDEASLSPGGGFGLDIVFGFLITPKIEIDLNAAYQSSALSKHLENADASFSRFYINSTLKFVIPAKKSNRAWKLGGGIGYYIPQYLRIEWKDISNVVDGDLEFTYNASIGYHAVGEYEMLFGKKNWSLLFNMTFYYTTYKNTSASSSSVTILDVGDFEKINGSSFNFGIAMKKYF
jgi:opacity protein-like surface antigen